MRIARDLGGVSGLLPEGCRLDDVPYLWFDAVRFGLMVLSFDELATDERPPKRIWRDGDALHEWFEMVKERRTAQTSGKHIEDPVDNAAAAALIVE